MSAIYTVITGDLIRSRTARAADVDAALLALQTAANDISRYNDFDTRFTRHRGDGWQIALGNPVCALASALQMFAALRSTGLKLDTRVSIGLGTVNKRLEQDLASADGPAFHASGAMLDRIGKRRMIMAGDGIEKRQARYIDALIDLIEAIAFGWSPAQAEAIYHDLTNRGSTHEDIAAKLGITRQAVQSRFASAHANAIWRAIEAFEDDMKCQFQGRIDWEAT